MKEPVPLAFAPMIRPAVRLIVVFPLFVKKAPGSIVNCPVDSTVREPTVAMLGDVIVRCPFNPVI